jgi:RNA polymerase sigma factor (TIGR02999 family)
MRLISARLTFPGPGIHPGLTSAHAASRQSSVTDLLLRARDGDTAAFANVFPLIYEELRTIAERQLWNERDGHTLSPTALVHEAYLRLIDYNRVEWAGRVHFLRVAATAMRRILVDHARGQRSLKRGGGVRRVSIDAIQLGADEQVDLLIAVDSALEKLKLHNERQAQVVECRFFGGMTEEETAEALDIGLRTVKRDWARAKSWLSREIAGNDMRNDIGNDVAERSSAA